MTKRQFLLATFCLFTVLGFIAVVGYNTRENAKIEKAAAVEQQRIAEEEATKRTHERMDWLNSITDRLKKD